MRPTLATSELSCYHFSPIFIKQKGQDAIIFSHNHVNAALQR